MVRQNIMLIVFWIIVAAAAWSYAIFFASVPAEYSYNVNGLLVESNEFNPESYFAELGNSKSFIVSPAMHEKVTATDQHVFAAATTVSVVLNGNAKEVEMLIRVFGEGNSLLYCLSNLGDVKTSAEISKEDCLAKLDSDARVRVLLEAPDSEIPMPYAMLEKNKITLKAQKPEQTNNAAFLVSVIMYPNAQDIINQSNTIIDKVISGQ